MSTLLRKLSEFEFLQAHGAEFGAVVAEGRGHKAVLRQPANEHLRRILKERLVHIEYLVDGLTRVSVHTNRVSE